MTTQHSGRWRRPFCAVGAAMLALAGCGGGQGGDDGAAAAVVSSGVGGSSTTTQTALAYAAQRPAPVPGNGALAADGQQALVAAGAALALAEFQPAYVLNYNNVLVAPPLLLAMRQAVAAAAAGETLAAWQAAFPPLTPPELAAAGTAAVTRQLWAQRGHGFQTAFLSATDGSAAPTRLQAWAADETGFDDATANNDAALAAGLVAAVPGLTWPALALDDPLRLRLLVADVLDAGISWPTQPVFEGVFQDAGQQLAVVPMLRLSAGVLRHQGADHVADSLTVAGRSLVMIRPDATDPHGFAASRLAGALAEALAALLGPGSASAPAGELLLPVSSLSVGHSVSRLAGAGGTAVAYDKVNANFKALDGGGSYLQTRAPDAVLTLAADGLRVQAAALNAFTFSPDNVNGPGSGSGGVVVTMPELPIVTMVRCPHPVPDLRSFFLALVDAQQGLLALVAVGRPGGQACF